ncbi:hypothetical protein AAW26_16860 [Vibrio alginolyticus]|nr:hypothetical protein AAW26_16860 [Vibrio alginolyticus]
MNAAKERAFKSSNQILNLSHIDNNEEKTMKKLLTITVIAATMFMSGCAVKGDKLNTYDGIPCHTIEQPGMADLNRPGCEK